MFAQTDIFRYDFIHGIVVFMNLFPLENASNPLLLIDGRKQAVIYIFFNLNWHYRRLSGIASIWFLDFHAGIFRTHVRLASISVFIASRSAWTRYHTTRMRSRKRKIMTLVKVFALNQKNSKTSSDPTILISKRNHEQDWGRDSLLVLNESTKKNKNIWTEFFSVLWRSGKVPEPENTPKT